MIMINGTKMSWQKLSGIIEVLVLSSTMFLLMSFKEFQTVGLSKKHGILLRLSMRVLSLSRSQNCKC